MASRNFYTEMEGGILYHDCYADLAVDARLPTIFTTSDIFMSIFELLY